MRVVLKTHNKFHNSDSVQYPRVEQVDNFHVRLHTTGRAERAAGRKLCGIKTCMCGNQVRSTVEGLPAEYRIVDWETQPDGGMIYEALRADIA